MDERRRGERFRRRRPLAFALLGAPLLVLAWAWGRSGAFRRVENVVESDRERITRIVWLGRWPMDRTERRPFGVSDDFRKVLHDAGVRIPKGLEGAMGSLIRTREPSGETYFLYQSRRPVTKDGATFVERQLGHARLRRAKHQAWVEGVGRDGKTRVWYLALDGPKYRHESLRLFVPPGETRAAGTP